LLRYIFLLLLFFREKWFNSFPEVDIFTLYLEFHVYVVFYNNQDTVYDPTTHPSILEIKNHVDVEKKFEFQHITSDKIEKIIDKINIKKASGFDNIPAKVIKQNFSETSHVSFIILLSSHRIIFRSPELHLLEKNGLTVFQKLTFLAPPVQRSRK
jgi:hypothetical protein